MQNRGGLFQWPRERGRSCGLYKKPRRVPASLASVLVARVRLLGGGLLDKTEIVVVQIRPRSVQISRKERESDMCERRRLFVSRCELSATEKRTAVPARRGSKRSSIDRSSTWAVIFSFNRRRRYGVSGFPCIVPSQPRPPPSPSSPCREGERENSCEKESPAAISRRRAESVVAVLSVRAGMRRRNSRRARTPAPRREQPGSRRAGASGRWLLRHHGAIAPTDSDAAPAAARRSPLRRRWWLPPLMTPSSCAEAAARLVSLRRTSRRSTRPAWAPCCVASSCFS